MIKRGLREAAIAARAEAHAAGLDGAAQRQLARHLAPFRGRVLAGYLPIRSEIDPRPVMAAWDGPVCVPKVVARGEPLRFVPWRPEIPLVTGLLGLHVPDESAGALAEITPEVLIVPLLAFDAEGHRLGYGGGFYDRTLAALRAAGPVTAFGFAYAAQEVEPLPAEPTDVPLDAVVTENGVRWFR